MNLVVRNFKEKQMLQREKANISKKVLEVRKRGSAEPLGYYFDKQLLDLEIRTIAEAVENLQSKLAKARQIQVEFTQICWWHKNGWIWIAREIESILIFIHNYKCVSISVSLWL